MRGEADDAAWMDQARCKGEDTNLFFPERGHPTDYAKALCAACPVRQECLDYALSHGERHGVWGGLAERSRRDAKTRRVLVVTRVSYCDFCGSRFTWPQKGNNNPKFCTDECRNKHKNRKRLLEVPAKCVICGAAGIPSWDAGPTTCGAYCAKVVAHRARRPPIDWGDDMDETG